MPITRGQRTSWAVQCEDEVCHVLIEIGGHFAGESTDGFEVDSQTERLSDLHNRRKTRIPLRRERLVETLSAHADAPSQLADVARAGNHTERMGDERRVIAGLLKGGPRDM